MSKLLLIKLGGSLITDKGKEFTAKPEVIVRLAQEILQSVPKFSGKIIIAHGSGSFGHTAAAKYNIRAGLVSPDSYEGLPIVADAAIQINRIVMQHFLASRLPAVSFSPASFILAHNGRPKKMHLAPIFFALEKNFLPVMYGDIVFDTHRGISIYSAETTLNILANKARHLFDDISVIYCGDTDGVYDQTGKTIPVVTKKSFVRQSKFITGSKNTDVTGGMLHKVKESLELAKKGIPTLIINGNRPGELKKAILSLKTKGTLVD